MSAPALKSRGAMYWTGVVVGLGILGYGIAGLLAHASATRPPKAATWIIGADLLHDLALAPLLGVVGWLVVRLVPRLLRAPVRAALIGTALVVAIGWIPWRGYGRLPDNPSLAPLDYASAMVTAVVAVWVACSIWAVVATLRSRSMSQRRGPT
jgi:hypothetical protein